MGETIVGTETMGFCATTANIWQVVGYVLLVFKIVIFLENDIEAANVNKLLTN